MLDNSNVSVIIPIYNDFKRLKKCVNSLLNQTVEPFEIIIVDNNSKKEEKNKIRRFVSGKSNIVMLEENKIQSSYAARNKGLDYASGDIIAFTDSDCIPKNTWIEKIQEGFKRSNTDALAGKIEFFFNNANDLAEIVDSLIHMQNKENVKNRAVATTANLAIKREVFDKIGAFDLNIKSGEDINWTRKLTKSGFKLIYDEEVIIKHPTRTEEELLQKLQRTVKGKKNLMQNSINKKIMYIIKNILPPNLKILKKAKNEYNISLKKIILIYIYLWKLKLFSVKFFFNRRDGVE